jgi:hypothetical protein
VKGVRDNKPKQNPNFDQFKTAFEITRFWDQICDIFSQVSGGLYLEISQTPNVFRKLIHLWSIASVLWDHRISRQNL